MQKTHMQKTHLQKTQLRNISESQLRTHPFSTIAVLTSFALGFVGCQHLMPSSSSGTSSIEDSKPLILPQDQGLIWMPFVWNVRLASEEEGASGLKRGGLSNVSLRSLGLNLKSAVVKKTVVLKMQVGTASRAQLDTGNPTETLFLEKFFPLPEGDYTVESLQATYIQPDSGKPIELQFPLENPFQPRATGGQGLPLQVKSGRIASLPRLAATTSFGMKDGSLVSLTEFDPVDREVVPLDLVLKEAKFPPSKLGLVYAASRDLPRSRVSLVPSSGDAFEATRAQVGVIVEVPCNHQGSVNFVWKRVGDDREYQYSLTTKQESCTDVRSVTGVFPLPEGQWVLRTLHFVGLPIQEGPYKTAVLKQPSKTVKDYLLLDEQQELLRFVSLERELKKQIQIDLSLKQLAEMTPQKGKSVPFLFMGRFQLLQVDTQKATSQLWDTVFKRTFSIPEIQKSFGEQEILNAYTLRPMSSGREKGTVQGVLKVTSAQSDAKKLEPFSAELRKHSTEGVAKCITERESKDPLVTAQGSAGLTALKGASTLTLKEIKPSLGKESPESKIDLFWLEDCLKKSFLDFRFSKKLPASFQAEFQFKAD